MIVGLQTYIDCLHIKKASKTRMAAEDPMDVDNSLRRVDEDVELDEEKVLHLLNQIDL